MITNIMNLIKQNFLGGAFRKAKYEIRRRRKKIGIGKRGWAKIPSPQPSMRESTLLGFLFSW
ncbi:hypothetical protein KJ557_02560 [Patescibacteria group bacterium]|nr:hypothetical protein [Patescibacteria group bacterium]